MGSMRTSVVRKKKEERKGGNLSMTKSVAYVQKYYASILLAAVLGYIGWIGIELNALGKDVATLKANVKSPWITA